MVLDDACRKKSPFPLETASNPCKRKKVNMESKNKCSSKCQAIQYSKKYIKEKADEEEEEEEKETRPCKQKGPERGFNVGGGEGWPF